MLVDLHSHYPMHVLAGDPDLRVAGAPRGGGTQQRYYRERLLRVANRLENYPGKGDLPAVTSSTLSNTCVRVALSVLYSPAEEIDFREIYPALPRPWYFEQLLRQIDMVEERVAAEPGITMALNPMQLRRILATPSEVALIHALEGGFHIGDSTEAIRKNVRILAKRGVAYITVAHLVFRQVATNAPAVPFISEKRYNKIFPQDPNLGLTTLGKKLVEEMYMQNILVDVSHMSERAIEDTLAIFNTHDSGKTRPIIASHVGARGARPGTYNLSDKHIKDIADRNGVIGLIACKHWMTPEGQNPKTISDSIEILCSHINHINKITGLRGDHQNVAIGTDQDGFIQPTLPGLEYPSGFDLVEVALTRRYGADVTARIFSGNALRVLNHWSGGP